jgi:hypothetical protein
MLISERPHDNMSAVRLKVGGTRTDHERMHPPWRPTAANAGPIMNSFIQKGCGHATHEFNSTPQGYFQKV